VVGRNAGEVLESRVETYCLAGFHEHRTLPFSCGISNQLNDLKTLCVDMHGVIHHRCVHEIPVFDISDLHARVDPSVIEGSPIDRKPHSQVYSHLTRPLPIPAC
jgi:hypothetical protein